MSSEQVLTTKQSDAKSDALKTSQTHIHALVINMRKYAELAKRENPADAIQSLVSMVGIIAEILCWMEAPKHVVEDGAIT